MERVEDFKDLEGISSKDGTYLGNRGGGNEVKWGMMISEALKCEVYDRNVSVKLKKSLFDGL